MTSQWEVVPVFGAVSFALKHLTIEPHRPQVTPFPSSLSQITAPPSQHPEESPWKPQRPHHRQAHHRQGTSSSGTAATPAATPSAPAAERINGGQALIRSLELEGTDTIFGCPAAPFCRCMTPFSIVRSVILVRHEQGAGHMAEGYAHATGRPGVAMVTSGPAATNIVTPLCDAYMDSVPMVCITGQVGTKSLGTDAFQEADTVGITRSVTKHNELVSNVGRRHPPQGASGVSPGHYRPPRPGAVGHPEGHRRPQQSGRLA